MPLPQVAPASSPLMFPPHLGSCQWLDNYQNSISHCPWFWGWWMVWQVGKWFSWSVSLLALGWKAKYPLPLQAVSGRRKMTVLLHQETSHSFPSQPLYVSLAEWVGEMVPGLVLLESHSSASITGHGRPLVLSSCLYGTNLKPWAMGNCTWHLDFSLVSRIVKPQSTAPSSSGMWH